MDDQKPKVAIIGGYGGMGRFFARIFRAEGLLVVISGPNQATGKKVAEELGVKYVKDNIDAVKDADIVIVSVPIQATLEVIKEIAPNVRQGSLLTDLTSVKVRPCEFMEKYSGGKVEVVGAHPLFSHRVAGLEGQVVVLTPMKGAGKWLGWLRGFLEDHKARVFETSPEEHDRVMAVVQGLTHFAYISIGKTLAMMDFDIKESRKFSSPVYELMLDMIGRIIGQNPVLYASIQMENPMIPEIHDVYIGACRELSESVRGRDTEAFVRFMRDAAKNFDDVDQAMGRSDKAINALVSELSRLNELVGSEVCLKHIYSGRLHYGVIKSVTPEKVVLESNNSVSELKISNLRILEGEDAETCKREIFGVTRRDYSVVLGENASEDYLAGLLEGYVADIVKVEVKDVYKGEQIGDGSKSVCFAIEMVDHRIDETDGIVKEFFRGIGGVLR